MQQRSFYLKLVEIRVKEEINYLNIGGKPTNLYICHSDDKLDKLQEDVSHLQQLIPDLKIPSIDEEQNNPEEAKSVYESCTKVIPNQDINQYPLLFKENIAMVLKKPLGHEIMGHINTDYLHYIFF